MTPLPDRLKQHQAMVDEAAKDIRADYSVDAKWVVLMRRLMRRGLAPAVARDVATEAVRSA